MTPDFEGGLEVLNLFIASGGPTPLGVTASATKDKAARCRAALRATNSVARRKGKSLVTGKRVPTMETLPRGGNYGPLSRGCPTDSKQPRPVRYEWHWVSFWKPMSTFKIRLGGNWRILQWARGSGFWKRRLQTSHRY